MRSRNPHQVSPPDGAPASGASASRRRPTAEDWHRTVVGLPDTSLPAPTPSPTPPRQQPAPPTPQPNPSGLPRWRISIFGYWISVFVSTPCFVVAVFAQEELFGLCLTAAYLTVAALRARDMGKPWWACFTALIPLIGFGFFLWFGLTPSKYSSSAPHYPKKKIIIGAIVGACALLAIPISIPLIALLSNDVPHDQPSLAKCDTWLRDQLRSATATPNTHTTNEAINAIQTSTPAQCPPGAWNPWVNNLGRDHLGNIDIRFSTTTAAAHGAPITLPADGTQRWVYLAGDDQWYSANLSDPSVLATPPTVSDQSAPAPTTAPPNQTSRPLLKEPDPQVGAALSCDNLFQQQLLVSTLATANADNANAVITAIQALRPAKCSPHTWNPWVAATAGTSSFPVNVPRSLSVDGTVGRSKPFVHTPWRDNLGNIGIDFDTSTNVQRGAPITPPINRSPRWMYLSDQGTFYGSTTSANTPVQPPIPTATVGPLWIPPANDQLQNIVPPTLQTVHTFGIPTRAVIGQVRNVSGRRMGHIQADCQVYAGDVQVASATTFTNSLAPGAKWQYQADLFDDTLQGSDYNIECLFNEW